MRRSYTFKSTIAAGLVLTAAAAFSFASPALAEDAAGRGASPVHPARGKTSFAIQKVAHSGPAPGHRWAPAPKHPKPAHVNPALECLRLLALGLTPAKPVLRQAPRPRPTEWCHE